MLNVRFYPDEPKFFKQEESQVEEDQNNEMKISTISENLTNNKKHFRTIKQKFDKNQEGLQSEKYNKHKVDYFSIANVREKNKYIILKLNKNKDFYSPDIVELSKIINKKVSDQDFHNVSISKIPETSNDIISENNTYYLIDINKFRALTKDDKNGKIHILEKELLYFYDEIINLNNKKFNVKNNFFKRLSKKKTPTSFKNKKANLRIKLTYLTDNQNLDNELLTSKKSKVLTQKLKKQNTDKVSSHLNDSTDLKKGKNMSKLISCFGNIKNATESKLNEQQNSFIKINSNQRTSDLDKNNNVLNNLLNNTQKEKNINPSLTDRASTKESTINKSNATTSSDANNDENHSPKITNRQIERMKTMILDRIQILKVLSNITNQSSEKDQNNCNILRFNRPNKAKLEMQECKDGLSIKSTIIYGTSYQKNKSLIYTLQQVIMSVVFFNQNNNGKELIFDVNKNITIGDKVLHKKEIEQINDIIFNSSEKTFLDLRRRNNKKLNQVLRSESNLEEKLKNIFKVRENIVTL